MKQSFKKHRGFTLVELMVATSIMIILIMFVTNIAVSMLRAYDNTVAALTASSDARSALDPLESDLTSAMAFDDAHYWFEVRYDGEEELGNLEAHSAPQIMLFSQTGDRTRRARTGGATSELPGELCAIRYELVQKSPFGDTVDSPENLSYILYRAVLNARDTLDVAVPYVVGATGKSAGEPEKQKPSEFWKSKDEIVDPNDEKKYTPDDWATQIQNFLIDGIVDITLVFWYDDFSDGKRKIAVISNPDLVTRLREIYRDYDVVTFKNSICAGSGKVVFDDNFSSAKSGALRSVDISLTVLGSDGKDTLLGLQRQNNAGRIDEEKFEAAILEHGTTFTRSIPLFSK